MKKRTKFLKIGVITVVAAALPIARAGIANADYAATPYDYVGVGGDTPQFALDFLANGDPDGYPGFNNSGNKDRLVTFDADPDANARAAYFGPNNSAAVEGSGDSTDALDPTDVLADGDFPTQRVSSSGNAISTLEADSADDINFIFSSTALSHSTNYATALHEYEFGTDAVSLVADKNTVAPAGLSDADLLGIYKTGSITNWDQITDVAGYTGPNAPIVPLIPPSSSAIATTFEKAINGGSTFTPFSDVTQVEQNDPNAITLNANPDDAIVPFSQARYYLFEGKTVTGSTLGENEPYFPATPGDSGWASSDAGQAYPAQSQYAPPIELLSSAATTTVTDYIDIRQSDLADTTNAEPGASVNWADYLFAGADGWSESTPTVGIEPYIATPTAQALIARSGVTPLYVDEGSFS